MLWPDRIPVFDAFDIVPHAVAVHDAATGLFGNVQHPAIHMGGNAGDHLLRRFAKAGGPVFADKFVIAANAARRQHNRRGA